MSIASESSYEEVIRRLEDFRRQIQDECGVLEHAAYTFVEQMNDDVNAQNHHDRLTDISNSIQMNLEYVDQVINGLKYQLERIRETQRYPY